MRRLIVNLVVILLKPVFRFAAWIDMRWQWHIALKLSKRRAELLTNLFLLVDSRNDVDAMPEAWTAEELKVYNKKFEHHCARLMADAVDLGIANIVLKVLDVGPEFHSLGPPAAYRDQGQPEAPTK